MYLPLLFAIAILLLVCCIMAPKVKEAVVTFAYCLVVVYLSSLLLGLYR